MGRIMNRKVVKHCACSERMQYPDKEKCGSFYKEKGNEGNPNVF
jgi:hypothetical protein